MQAFHPPPPKSSPPRRNQSALHSAFRFTIRRRNHYQPFRRVRTDSLAPISLFADSTAGNCRSPKN